VSFFKHELLGKLIIIQMALSLVSVIRSSWRDGAWYKECNGAPLKMRRDQFFFIYQVKKPKPCITLDKTQKVFENTREK